MKTDLSGVDSHRNARPRWRLLAVCAGLAAATAAVLMPGSATAGNPPGSVQPNIIGGHAATEPYSFMVGLSYDAPNHGRENFFTCGGTLYSRGIVVTAAHCVTDLPAGLSAAEKTRRLAMYRMDNATAAIPVADKKFHVRIGSLDRTTGGTLAEVTHIAAHPEWDWETTPGEVGDIAVLRLASVVNDQPAELAGNAGKPGVRVRQLGWGITEPDHRGPLPTSLQELDTKLLKNSKCPADTAIGPIGDLCLENPYGTSGPCNGDSGSPGLRRVDGRWQWIGVTSRGGAVPCGDGPAVYTDATHYRRWLKDTARTIGQPGTA